MRKYIVIVFLLFWVDNIFANISVNEPEMEVPLSISKLENLYKNLKNSKKMLKSTINGDKEAYADIALKKGIIYFFHEEYHSAIRELNSYLNKSQVHVEEHYLSAVYKLAISYENINDYYSAISSYLKYIAGFITHDEKNFDELTEVMRRLLSLAAMPEISKDHRVEKLLASLTSLDLPGDVKTEVMYLAARTAIKTGNQGVASEWFDRTLKDTEDDEKKIQVLYFKALMEVSRKNWDKAESYIVEAIAIDPGKSNESKDIAKMALARISVQNEKSQTALKLYSSIGDDSILKKEALFESIYLLIRMELYTDARNLATILAARYPDSGEAVQLKSLMAFFELKAGNIQVAKADVSSHSGELESLNAWIQTSIRNKSKLESSDIYQALEKTKYKMEQPQAVQYGLELYSQLSRMQTKISHVKGEMRNLLYTVGRASIDQLRPEWENRAKQLRIHSESALEIGHKLAAAEKYLYSESLSENKKFKLEASEKRRVALMSLQANLRQYRNRWATYGNLLNLTQDVAKNYQKIDSLNGIVTSLNFLNTNKSLNMDRKIKIQTKQISDLRESLGKALELIRQHRLNELYVQSSHLGDLKFLNNYASTLESDAIILESVRENATNLSVRTLAEDSMKAWELWRFVMNEIHSQYDELSIDMKNDIQKMLGEIDEIENKYLEYSNLLESYQVALSYQLGKASDLISGQYSHSISKLLSRQRKWAADLEWIEYEKLEDQKQNKIQKFKLEKQILDENLQDLNEGVLWKWSN